MSYEQSPPQHDVQNRQQPAAAYTGQACKQQQQEAERGAEPQHHPEPQQPVIVVVERDFSTLDACRYTTFADTLPPRLAALQVSADELGRTVRRINAVLREAETLGWRTLLDGCLGCLTLFTWHACRPPPYAQTLRRVEEVIASENETVYNKKRLQVLNPISNGLLEIEFRVLS